MARTVNVDRGFCVRTSVLSGALRETMGAQVKTAPGTHSANCESDSQGLARRYEGAPN